MVIALGRVDFVRGKGVSEGYGEAYQLSSRALETMPKGNNMCFVFPENEQERVLDVVIQLIDAVSARWSDKQALAVTGVLRGWKQETIAETWWKKKVSQQAVAHHLARAGWYPVEKGILFLNFALEKNCLKTGKLDCLRPSQIILRWIPLTYTLPSARLSNALTS